MTVKELQEDLKSYPASAKVYFVKDWENCDDRGVLNEVAELRSVTSQKVIEDMGLDFEEYEEVLLDFEME